jgi:glycosyltransferase involved in cell wall biosynthesis
MGGAEISLLSFLEHLDRRKYELYIGIPAGELYETLSTYGYLSVVRFPLRRFTVKLDAAGLITSFSHMLATSIRISLFVYKKGIDIVYANSTQAMVYCSVIRMLTLKKIIWHVRDTITNKMVATILSWSATRVICVSGFIFDQLPVRASKKEIVYNALDTTIWRPPANSANFLKADLGLGKNEVLVKSFKNVHFIIIGDDLFNENVDYTDELKNNIQIQGLEKNISFIGHRKNIKDYMSCLDIVMHCSIDEPFGRVIIESMALGKPVIAYDSGGPREIIADQVTGFLASETVEAMAGKLLLLLKDAALRTAFGKAGRQRVEQKFTLEEHIIRIESILDALI